MTTIGFRPITWKGPKRPCAKCGRMVRRGIVHVNDHQIPPAHCLCTLCYQKIMSADGANAPKGTPGFE